MRTIFESLRSKPDSFFSIGNADAIRSSLDESHLLLIDNVAEYYWESENTDWIYSDFPNLAPPFNSFFMEYKFPTLLRVGDETRTNVAIERMGALFIAQKLGECADDDWRYFIMIFQQANGKLSHWPFVYSFQVTASGGFHFLGEKSIQVIHSPKISPFTVDPGRWGEAIWTAITPFLLSISFLHCKNVKIVSNYPRHSPSRRNKHSPKVVYKTLAIEPMKKVLAAEGKSGEVGLKRALHICRGHFKDFSEKGLFGKYKGIYWWESHVRGKIDNGIVFKDYEVKAGTNG